MKLTMGWNIFDLMKSQTTLMTLLMPFQTGVMIESLNHLNAAPSVFFRYVTTALKTIFTAAHQI